MGKGSSKPFSIKQRSSTISSQWQGIRIKISFTYSVQMQLEGLMFNQTQFPGKSTSRSSQPTPVSSSQVQVPSPLSSPGNCQAHRKQTLSHWTTVPL